MTTITQARDDVDEVAVHRCITGHPPALISVPEMEAAIRALREQGMPHRDIAHHIGVSERTVNRHLPMAVAS